MAELLKNIYNTTFFKGFTKTIEKVVPHFNNLSFTNSIFNADWENKELKQRMRHITIVLKEHLSTDFDQNVTHIINIINKLEHDGEKETSIEYMFFPDFIEFYGLNQYETSIRAFERITQFTSCEFAVRPFIIEYQHKMIDQMYLWSKHNHAMVRRLATEGCRPRLPWAMALPELKEKPSFNTAYSRSVKKRFIRISTKKCSQ